MWFVGVHVSAGTCTWLQPVISMHIAFLHPDLGIGGAERLVVDAAVGLQELGHKVSVYTSHCDPLHCFDEVLSGEVAVAVAGDWLPTHVLGRFAVVCAIVRQLWLVLWMTVSGRLWAYDVLVVDQLLVCMPVLKFFVPNTLLVFYGHFPDRHLARRDLVLRQVYRAPFDWLEGGTTALADRVVVNSEFTKGVFHETFPWLQGTGLEVIYPCVGKAAEKLKSDSLPVLTSKPFFLSVNRFESAKNVELAIRAFAAARLPCRLVVAGGYDVRNAENKANLEHLEGVCRELLLGHAVVRGPVLALPQDTVVVFLPSVALLLKAELMAKAVAVLYTPLREHFGIVPLEAMQAGTPVVAVNSGGPLETVVDGETGWLVAPQEDLWAEAMGKAWAKRGDHKMGRAGKARVEEKFSRAAMAKALEKVVTTVPERKFNWTPVVILGAVTAYRWVRG